MSYLEVRGNLGGCFAQVKGLSPAESEHISLFLRRGAKLEDSPGVSYHNSVVDVLNELELRLGYQVIATTNTTKSNSRFPDVIMWTMHRPDRWCLNFLSDKNSLRRMPYICVKGTLGMANTRIYGLNEDELERIAEVLRVADTNEALTVHNAPMYAINQIEYHLGYVIITATNQERYTIWTMQKKYERNVIAEKEEKVNLLTTDLLR